MVSCLPERSVFPTPVLSSADGICFCYIKKSEACERELSKAFYSTLNLVPFLAHTLPFLLSWLSCRVNTLSLKKVLLFYAWWLKISQSKSVPPFFSRQRTIFSTFEVISINKETIKNFQLSKTEKSIAQNKSPAPPTLILSLCLERRSWKSFSHASPSFLSSIVSKTHLSLTLVSIIPPSKDLFSHFRESELLGYHFFF